MALTPLTNLNSFTRPDGRVGVFVGNQNIAANKLRVAALDGSGTSLYNAQAYTTSTDNSLVVYIGPSHESGGVRGDIEPVHVHVDRYLTQSGVFQPVASQHVFAGSGKRNDELRGMYFENTGATSANNVLLFIDSVKANFTQVLVVYHALNINDFPPANYSAPIIANARWMSQQLSLRGCKVVLVVNPTTTRYAPGGTNEYAPFDERVQRLYGEVLADNRANYRLEYGAATECSSLADDPPFTAAQFLQGTAVTDDGTHPNNPYMLRWVAKHIVGQIIDALNYQPPARLAPANMVISVPGKTLTFSKTAADSLAFHFYRLNSSASWQPVGSTPISLPDGTHTPEVRVEAYGGQVAGPALVASQSYTIGGSGGGGTAPVDVVMEATLGTPNISGTNNNTIKFTEGNFTQLVRSVEAFAGDFDLTFDLVDVDRGVFFGVGEAGAPGAGNQNLEISTDPGASVGMEYFYPYMFNGAGLAYEWLSYGRYKIARRGDVGRIARADDQSIPRFNMPGTTVNYIEYATAFLGAGPVRVNAAGSGNNDIHGGVRNIQIQRAGLLPF